MLAQEAIPIQPEETAGELEARLAPLGARLAKQVIDQISAGTAKGMQQDKSQVTRAPKLTKEHGLIDWQRSAPEVCNQIRAMQPWPTAYTYLHRQGEGPLRLIIAKASCLDRPPVDTITAGAVLIRPEEPGRLLAAAGAQSVVELLEIQPAGKRRMPAAEFLRGHRLRAGDFFGPEIA
jgi:methionyl-tRNA formyltransferase